ncbi:hypothetical protein A2U01_0046589, partial [Trifolium medium]|nr:hypothetical protein [Trifolium medium]
LSCSCSPTLLKLCSLAKHSSLALQPARARAKLEQSWRARELGFCLVFCVDFDSEVSLLSRGMLDTMVFGGNHGWWLGELGF